MNVFSQTSGIPTLATTFPQFVMLVEKSCFALCCHNVHVEVRLREWEREDDKEEMSK